MAAAELEKHISSRYYRWLDYAVYHCTHANIKDEANDVLNEVLLMLIKRHDEKKLLDMLNRKSKNGHTELDFFILNMIKVNIYSPTSVYRYKNKPIKRDANVNISKLDITAENDQQTDTPKKIIERCHKVREQLDGLGPNMLDPQHRLVFEFKFFAHKSFDEWEGPETINKLYSMYQKVLEMLREKHYRGDDINEKGQQLSLF